MGLILDDILKLKAGEAFEGQSPGLPTMSSDLMDLGESPDRVQVCDAGVLDLSIALNRDADDIAGIKRLNQRNGLLASNG